MRRALLKQWPALSKFYGLFPWDCDRLTLDEIREYLDQYADYQREMKRQQRRGR